MDGVSTAPKISDIYSDGWGKYCTKDLSHIFRWMGYVLYQRSRAYIQMDGVSTVPKISDIYSDGWSKYCTKEIGHIFRWMG
jgi:hypothetical protein